MDDRSVPPSDPLLLKFEPSELRTASEFLTTWLPFLSRDLCPDCSQTLSDRVRSLGHELDADAGPERPNENSDPLNSDPSNSDIPKLQQEVNQEEQQEVNQEVQQEVSDDHDENCDTNSIGSWKDGWSGPVAREQSTSGSPSHHRMSWADIAQEEEDEFGEEEKVEEVEEDSETTAKRVVDVNAATGKLRISMKAVEKPKTNLSREQREYTRFMKVKREKDFICFERLRGKLVNILEGLELHTGIFSAAEQKKIVDTVYIYQEKGRKGELKERTYTAPTKWMRGKGRVTIQFGCCYNYAMDKNAVLRQSKSSTKFLMSDFGRMEDWDLQAVVRGCINEARPTIFGNPKSCFAPLSAVEDDLLSFPEISETATVLDELDKLYKPLIYPVLQPVPSQTILASSVSVPKEIKQPEQKPSIKEPRRSRKNQHKRVVQHVTAAEGLCSDMWAWRKYGQKPIKGSPYPRSYYRCSSSKGCSARKQVERSPLEPGVFIVTYSSEHNHTRPTRRNSLAGSTRSKFPTPKRKNNSPSSSKVLSPTTPLMASIEDEFVQSASLKKEEEQMVQENENNGTFNMPDMILDSDIDLFPSLEDFDELTAEPAMDGCFLDQLLDNFPVPWFVERSTAVSDGH